MSDTPLYRDGKVVLKVRKNPDDTVFMYKPFVLREKHLLNMTGAPGWDQHHVDAVFGEGVDGELGWIFEGTRYEIGIAEFRQHAFVKEVAPFGRQYHVHQKYWRQILPDRTVSPLREGTPRVGFEEAKPPKLEFGLTLVCDGCNGTGKKNKQPCVRCHGFGVVKRQEEPNAPKG